MKLLLPASVALLAACNDFTPHVGPLLPMCSQPDASADATSPAIVAGYVITGGCPDAGHDAATNSLVANAGVAGNVLIADQLNNRVIIVDRAGDLLWQFGNGDNTPSTLSIVAPNDAELLPSGEVLMVGTGGQAGCDGGPCVDDRVLIVDYATKDIVWQFGGHAEGTLGSGELKGPSSARLVPTASGDHVLIADQGNGRVVEVVRATGHTFWVYPDPDDAGDYECSPQTAERLATGNTLIANQGTNLVVEVTPAKKIMWQYPKIIDVAALSFPSSASRLPGGHTLIADTNNNRVLELDENSDIVWSYVSAQGTVPNPTSAIRLQNGHTLVTLLAVNQVIEVDHATPPNLVYSHGQSGVAGVRAGQLNMPYDAKVVGDYTGITSPTLDASAGQ